MQRARRHTQSVSGAKVRHRRWAHARSMDMEQVATIFRTNMSRLADEAAERNRLRRSVPAGDAVQVFPHPIAA